MSLRRARLSGSTSDRGAIYGVDNGPSADRSLGGTPKSWLRSLVPSSGYSQQWSIDNLRDDLQHMQRLLNEASSKTQPIDQLVRENSELKLVVATMLRLLMQRGIVTSTEFQALAAQVDFEDGRLDGKVAGPLMSADFDSK